MLSQKQALNWLGQITRIPIIHCSRDCSRKHSKGTFSDPEMTTKMFGRASEGVLITNVLASRWFCQILTTIIPSIVYQVIYWIAAVKEHVVPSSWVLWFENWNFKLSSWFLWRFQWNCRQHHNIVDMQIETRLCSTTCIRETAQT